MTIDQSEKNKPINISLVSTNLQHEHKNDLATKVVWNKNSWKFRDF